MSVSIVSSGNDDLGQSPTQRYAEARWRERPAIVPSSWRVSQGLTVGKLVHDARLDAAGVKDALADGCNGILASAATVADVLHAAATWPGGREEVVVMVVGEIVEGVDVVFVESPSLEAFECCERLVKAGRLGFYGIVAAADTDMAGVMEVAAAAAAKVWERLKRPMLRALVVPLDAGDVQCAVECATSHKGEPVSVLEYAARMDWLVVADGRDMAELLVDEASVAGVLSRVVTIEQEVYARLGGWPERDGVPYFCVWRTLLAGVPLFPTVGSARRWRGSVLPDLTAFWCGQGEDTYTDALLVLGDVCEAVGLMAIRARLGWNGVPLSAVAANVAASVPGVTCVLGGGCTLPFYSLADVVDVARVVEY